ncbi:HCLS1-associated protein X-1 isoform X2 [Trichomycterus rosablanca]|uniref:HCLS1-associated protein X-1 isoform X2 n=1 Tax=Trichomycterus rosablanca TaxID=2290929 RepID=UPI002F351BFB
MSVFDLFRGFFGQPRGHYRGDDRREPFFDGLTHEDDDEDDSGDTFYLNDLDKFDDVLRFGFSLGPNGMHIHEPPLFGQIFREMEEIFSGLGHFSQDFPSIEAPPREEPGEIGRRGGGRGTSLRDFMLKTPDDPAHKSPSVVPREESPSTPSIPRGPFDHWAPFSRFRDFWGDEPRQRIEEKKEDRDLDSRVSSGGLDQILTPAPTQPKIKSFFHSETVTKVVKPDGAIEERRTVRDGRGNETTTVTHSGPGSRKDPLDQSTAPTPGSERNTYTIYSYRPQTKYQRH